MSPCGSLSVCPYNVIHLPWDYVEILNQIRDNRSKQCPGYTVCLLLVGRLRPQSPENQSKALWL